MTLSRVVFSSASEHWATPKNVYDALDKEFHFTLDPCPIYNKDPKYGTPETLCGLERSWKGERIYCNPPYGRSITNWLAKAREAELCVFLLPARTDTKWWHEYAMKADEIRFLKGRLKFGDSKTGAPFPSVVLVYNKFTALDRIEVKGDEHERTDTGNSTEVEG